MSSRFRRAEKLRRAKVLRLSLRWQKLGDGIRRVVTMLPDEKEGRTGENTEAIKPPARKLKGTPP